MRHHVRQVALLAGTMLLLVLPSGAAAQSGYDPALVVTPGRVTAADTIAVSWRRPTSPAPEDAWSLCRVGGGDCRTGRTAAATAAIDGLTEGRYEFELRTAGTGLVYTGRFPIVIDRTPPGTPRVIDWRPPGAAGGTMRPALEASEPQNAAIVAVRWLRCVGPAQPGGAGCLEGRSAPDDIAIPIDPLASTPCGAAPSTWTVLLWLQDAAGNEDRTTGAVGASPTAGLVPCPPPPPPPPPAPKPPAVRRAVTLRPSGTLRGPAARRRGRLAVRVTAGATGAVRLRVTPRRGTRRLAATTAARPLRAGRVSWSGRLPARTTSVVVVASYGGDATHAAARRTFVVRLTPRR